MARLTSITKKEQVPAEYHDTFDAVVKSRGSVHGPFSMAMHCPPIAGHLVNLGGYVRFEGKLDMRVRVLAAMTVAREFDCLYVWGAQTGSACPNPRLLQSAKSTRVACLRKTHKSSISRAISSASTVSMHR